MSFHYSRFYPYRSKTYLNLLNSQRVSMKSQTNPIRIILEENNEPKFKLIGIENRNETEGKNQATEFYYSSYEIDKEHRMMIHERDRNENKNTVQINFDRLFQIDNKRNITDAKIDQIDHIEKIITILEDDVSKFYQEKPITYINLQSKKQQSILTGINYKKLSMSNFILKNVEPANKSIFEKVCEEILIHNLFKSKKLALTISLVQDDKIIEVAFEKDLFKNFICIQGQPNNEINKFYKSDNSNIEHNPTLISSNSNKSIQNTTFASSLSDNKYIRKVKLFNGQTGYFVENMSQIKIAMLKAIEFYEKIEFDLYKKNTAINEIYGKSKTVDNPNIEAQMPFSFLIQLTLFPILSSDYYSERKKLQDYNQIIFFDLFYQSSFQNKTVDCLINKNNSSLSNPKQLKEENCILVKTLNSYLNLENPNLKLFTNIGFISKKMCKILLNIGKATSKKGLDLKKFASSKNQSPKRSVLEKYQKIQLFNSPIIENILENQSNNQVVSRLDPLLLKYRKEVNQTQRNTFLTTSNSEINYKPIRRHKIIKIPSQNISRINQFSGRTLKNALMIEHPLFPQRKFLNYETNTPSKTERKYKRSFVPSSQIKTSRKLFFQKESRPSTEHVQITSISNIYNVKKPVLQEIKPIEVNYPQL